MAITPKKVSVTGPTSLLDSKTFSSIIWTETKTAGSNTFTVDASTTTAVLTLTGASGDVVKINGYSGDFIASLSGAKLTLASNTQTISVTLAAASKLNLSFTDKTKVVDYAAKTLDGHVLTKTAWKIDGQTQFGADALKAALTDASGKYYTTLAEAIKSDNVAEIDSAISKATGGAITKVDDLKTAYTPAFSVAAAASADEGTNATFTVKLSLASASATSVNFSLAALTGSSTTTDDYGTTPVVSGTGASVTGNVLTFAPNTTTATLSFPITSDSTVETGEGITLALTAVTGSKAIVSPTQDKSSVKINDVAGSLPVAVDKAHPSITATPAAENFKFDFQMINGRATNATTSGESTITGFNVQLDKITFNDVGTGTVYTEAQFKALPGVSISENPFQNNTTIYVDPLDGVSGGITIVGLTDKALSQIVLETTA
jgi:hypothetical protein